MRQWWYVDKGEKKGPVEEDILKSLLQSDKISLSTLVWQEGMSNWQAIGEIEELSYLKSIVPPPIPKSTDLSGDATNPPPLPETAETITDSIAAHNELTSAKNEAKKRPILTKIGWMIGILVILLAMVFAKTIGRMAGKSAYENFNKGKTDVAIEQAFIETAKDINKQLPIMVDKETRLDNVIASKNIMLYKYTMVNLSGKDVDNIYFYNTAMNMIAKIQCNNADTVKLLNAGARYCYIYNDKNGNVLANIVITKDVCGGNVVTSESTPDTSQQAQPIERSRLAVPGLGEDKDVLHDKRFFKLIENERMQLLNELYPNTFGVLSPNSKDNIIYIIGDKPSKIKYDIIGAVLIGKNYKEILDEITKIYKYDVKKYDTNRYKNYLQILRDLYSTYSYM